MVEVAKEVAKPDYLSLVNKSGSGFNVSELVDAIVGSEIEPKRTLQKTKQEKTENAISGIGFLTSQASSTQSSFTSLKSDTFFEINSSNTTGITLKVADETKLQPGTRNISSVTMAKKMAFEFGGFSNLNVMEVSYSGSHNKNSSENSSRGRNNQSLSFRGLIRHKKLVLRQI